MLPLSHYSCIACHAVPGHRVACDPLQENGDTWRTLETLSPKAAQVLSEVSVGRAVRVSLSDQKLHRQAQ